MPFTPSRLCPGSSLVPAADVTLDTRLEYRVPSPTAVPVVGVLTAHGMKILALFHGAGWNLQLSGKHGSSPIYQKAGLGQTRRERCTSESAPI